MAAAVRLRSGLSAGQARAFARRAKDKDADQVRRLLGLALLKSVGNLWAQITVASSSLCFFISLLKLAH